MEDKKTKSKKLPTGFTLHNILTVIGITVTVMLIPILMLNMILIVKGTTNSERPPSVFGVTPLVVLSGSMDDGSYDAISIGDLILVKEADVNNLKENEVVAFMEDGYAVTHRIVAVNEENGKVTYTTRGDANNSDDTIPLDPANVIGRYFYRIPKIGNFILYLQTTGGMLLFVGLPLLLFVIYDVTRRHMFTRSEQAKQDQLRKELEELKRRPAQANAYKPVQGKVLQQPITPPNISPATPRQPEQGQHLNYEKPLPPLPPELQPLPQAEAKRPVSPPPPPSPLTSAPKPQPAPQEPKPQISATVGTAVPAAKPVEPIAKAPQKAKPVVKKATVQIKKSTKLRK